MTSSAYVDGQGTRGRSARRLERRRLLFWLLPPLAWFTVFMLIPYAMLLYTSLGHVDDMRFIPGLSFDNFVRVLTVDPYLSVILKSARIGLMTSVLFRDRRLSSGVLSRFSRSLGTAEIPRLSACHRSMVGELSRQSVRLENNSRFRRHTQCRDAGSRPWARARAAVPLQ